jgi:hypothetical protein
MSLSPLRAGRREAALAGSAGNPAREFAATERAVGKLGVLSAIPYAPDRRAWVYEGFSNKMLNYDSEGHLVYPWGTFGVQPGNILGVRSFDTDSVGNL